MAREHLEKMRKEEFDKFQTLIKSDQKAAEYAMNFGAQYVVRAVARIQYTGRNRYDRPISVIDVGLRGVDVASSGVVLNLERDYNGPSNCLNEICLHVRSVKKAAAKIMPEFISGFLRSIRGDARYVVILYGMKDYRHQGRAFMEVLKSIKGASDTDMVSQGGGRLEAEVFYPARLGSTNLLHAILDAAARKKHLSSLDSMTVRGRKLAFEFIR